MQTAIVLVAAIASNVTDSFARNDMGQTNLIAIQVMTSDLWRCSERTPVYRNSQHVGYGGTAAERRKEIARSVRAGYAAHAEPFLGGPKGRHIAPPPRHPP